MSVQRPNIYQPWNPRRLELASTAAVPFDLILRLSDHPIDPAKAKPEERKRIPVKEGVYDAVLINRTDFDLVSTVRLIKYLSEQCTRYQTNTQNVPTGKVLPFVCHFHAAPDPLSPAWLPTFVELLEQTATFNVQWSIFTDGTFWIDPKQQPHQTADAQDCQDWRLEEKLKQLNQLVHALHDNRLNVMLYTDQRYVNGATPSDYDYPQQCARLQCRKYFYSLANLLAESGLTNLCVAIGPTYANCANLALMMQEATIAGAQPVLGRPQPFYDYREFYQTHPFMGRPSHYYAAGHNFNQLQIDTFNYWCDHQKEPLPHYQPPTCAIPQTALFMDEHNMLSISAQSTCGCSSCKDARYELGSISGDERLQPSAVLQLIKASRKHHRQPSSQLQNQKADCCFCSHAPS